jgi:cellulose synthase/poly-beta-1,6-N-acetylglucosamine synthase-like glycosyltransferase
MVLIFVAICLSEWGRRKAKHYSYDISLKEWLENNIRDFDKSIVRLKKSWFLKYGFGMLFLSIFIILRIFIVGLDHMIVLLAYAVGLTSMIIASKIGTRATLRRMEKSRSGLQELYDQLYYR